METSARMTTRTSTGDVGCEELQSDLLTASITVAATRSATKLKRTNPALAITLSVVVVASPRTQAHSRTIWAKPPKTARSDRQDRRS